MKKLLALVALAAAGIAAATAIARNRGQDLGELAEDWTQQAKDKAGQAKDKAGDLAGNLKEKAELSPIGSNDE